MPPRPTTSRSSSAACAPRSSTPARPASSRPSAAWGIASFACPPPRPPFAESAPLEDGMIEDTTCSQRLEAYFRANRVPYQVQFHRWADSAKEIAAVERVPEKDLAKVVMVVAD